MDFIDRTEEMDRLESLVARSGGGFGVVWGRRRVGKTRLLLEWCRKHKGLYTVADQSAAGIQRRYFAETVARRFPGFQDVEYPDWRSLLDRLAREAISARWRGPLILDELPYLAEVSRELPSVLQRWIDHEAATAGLVTVVAGSCQRMMQGLVLGSSSPLYGRASEVLGLKPLRAGYIREALRLKTAREAVEAYSTWGGTPRYWELAEPDGRDLDGAVDRCVLNPMSPLHSEPDRLLLEEMPPASPLRPILDAIGMGCHRLSEIAARMGQPATSLGRPLSRLQELGLVEREIPFGESEKTGKRALYRIADPFFRLWFRVVAPHRSILATGSATHRVKLWNEAKQQLFAANWEELCRACVPWLHARSTPIGRWGPWQPACRYWRGDGPEWDIVARSTDGKRLLLGEVKWTERRTVATVLRQAVQALLKKGLPPVPPIRELEVVRVVCVPEAAHSQELLDDVHIVDGEAVLACLV